jgi:Subtilase family
MTRGSSSLLMGSIATAMILTACGGGAGNLTPTSAPAQASQQGQAMPGAANPAIWQITIAVTGTPTIGSPGTYPLTITAESADGTIITGRYPMAITLSDSDKSGSTRLTRTQVPKSGTAVSLIYSGKGGSPLGGFKGATITAASGTASAQIAFLASASTCVTIRGIGGLYPCDLQNAYSLPSMTAGTGQTVALVDAYDYPSAESDLDVYRSEFGLPPCTTANHCFRKVNQQGIQGKPPGVDLTGWSVEESLDLDMVSAICPNCHIILVEANSDNNADLGVSVDVAARLGATQISNSYGGPEFKGETAGDKYYNHAGITVVVSSGDSDYGVAWPASSPYVTSAGGTSLSVQAGARGWNEFVWNNEDLQGAGSGCSAYEPKPIWQKDAGCHTRMDNDVAAVADPFTGVATYDTYIVTGETLGGWETLGGTSAAAPIISAVYALGGASGQSLDYASYSYTHRGALNDIISGNNGSCTIAYFCHAEAGYDGPTGNGTPNGLGAFGGPALRSARAVDGHATWRHVIQATAGSPVRRACANPKPGFLGCDVLMVTQ